MNNLCLRKSFDFSASYARDRKIISHNYRLVAEIQDLAPQDEKQFSQQMNERLISKVHSCDLGQDVDFLKGLPLDEKALLERFWPIVREISKPGSLSRLTLFTDDHTQWVLRETEAR